MKFCQLLIPRLHDRANVDQMYSKYTCQLLDVFSMFAGIYPASSTSYGN